MSDSDSVVVTAGDDGSVRFEVRVTPRARQNAVGGVHAGALRVVLTAAPVDGAANAALTKLLAKELGVSKSAVEIERGHTARIKLVRVRGIDPSAVRACAERGR